MEKENPIREKSYAFALRIVLFTSSLEKNKEFILSRQLLKSGTSIGANIEEALQGQSRNDFISKLSIAHKEAFESRYWLRLIHDTRKAPADECKALIQQVEEIIRLLTSIIKTSRAS